MVTYEYRGLNADGRKVCGFLEAVDLKSARQELRRRQIFAETVVSPDATGRFGRRSFSLATRSLLYQELALLLRSGLTLTEALEITLQAPDFAGVRSKLAEVRDRVRQGEPFAASVAVWQADSAERAVLEAGEKAAVLAQVLEKLGNFLEEQRSLRERVSTALLYPAIVAGLALIIATGLLGVALPRFAGLMLEARLELPAFTTAMLRLGNVVMLMALPIALVVLGISLFCRYRLRNDAEFALHWDRRLLKLPFFKITHVNLAALRFVRTMEMLLAGGVAMVEALPLAGESAGNRWLAKEIKQAAHAVKHGAGVAEVMQGIPALGVLLGGWIGVGEATGMLEDVMRNLGDRLQRRWERLITRRLTLLEPLLIITMGVVVLLVALAVLLPITRLNQIML